MPQSIFYKSKTVPKLVIHQIYLWFITMDNKVIIVSTKPGKWQLPGGKPNENENYLETVKRECFEEAGLTLSEDETPNLFGYYLVSGDETWPENEYLQLRYFVKSKRFSNDISLSINEPEDLKMVKEVKFVELTAITEYIKWMNNSDEYIAVLESSNSL
ncbi:MAG: NUDIX domain-containing protein [Candidatus Dojkabacteria bacterium]